MKNILFFLFIGSFHVFAQQVNVTFNVDMTYQSVSDLGVHLVRFISRLDPSLTQMNDDNDDNIYSVTLLLGIRIPLMSISLLMVTHGDLMNKF